MPLAAREQLELGFTIALTLFVVAALATLRPERADALLMAGVFLVQLVYPLRSSGSALPSSCSSSPSICSSLDAGIWRQFCVR